MSEKTSPRKENLLVNLLVNIVIPAVIMGQFNEEDSLGPTWSLIVALAFPISYGLRDFYLTRKVNFFSALGFINTLLTGVIVLSGLGNNYIAIKEAAVPTVFAIATLISLKTEAPLVKMFLYNETIMQTEKVANALAERNNTEAFERALRKASVILALSFVLSAVLNYTLATILVVGEPNSPEQIAGLAKLQYLSIPVIALPAMLVMGYALYYLFKEIKKLTDLTLDEILINPKS